MIKRNIFHSMKISDRMDFEMEKTTQPMPPNYTINPFGYMPNHDLAIVSTAIYAFITLILTIQSFYYRSWFFMVMTISGISEVVGYAYRWLLTGDPTNISNYIIMSCCIILAPVGLAFTDYLLVGRLIRRAGREYSIVNPRIVEIGFVISDFLSIGIQSAGAGFISGGTNDGDMEKADLGSKILIAGLVINLISFCFFALVTIALHWSIIRRKVDYTGTEKWIKMFYALYLSMAILIIRSVYRIVEFAMGFQGYVATHELYFYIFECLLIVFAFGLFIPLHPGIWLKQDETLKIRGNRWRKVVNH